MDTMNRQKYSLMNRQTLLRPEPARLCGPDRAECPARTCDLTLLDDRPAEKGFLRIFNGKDLTGWDGNPKLWSVKDGAITGQTTAENPAKGNTFLIWTNGTVADFELRCSFKLVPGDSQGFANSGIQYRSKVLDPANWVVGGYQADMEAGPTYTGILYEERIRGIMAAARREGRLGQGRQETGRRLGRGRRRNRGRRSRRATGTITSSSPRATTCSNSSTANRPLM